MVGAADITSALTSGQIAAFLSAAIVLTIAPGPDNLMVVGLALAQGRRRGVLFGLGCAAGTVMHTGLAVMGISALLAASPVAFGALKVMGGVYLAWLAVQTLRYRNASIAERAQTARSDVALFVKGMGAAAINPKVILFFLAFLPQFLVPEQGTVWFQTLSLGLLFSLQGAVVLAVFGLFSGTLGRHLAANPAIARALNILAGAVFLILAGHLLSQAVLFCAAQ